MSAPTLTQHLSWCDETACRSLPNGDGMPPTVFHVGEKSGLVLGDHQVRTCLSRDVDPVEGTVEFIGVTGLDLEVAYTGLWLTLEEAQALADRLQRLLDVAAQERRCAR